MKAWQSCSLESTGTGLQLSFEDFPGGVWWGWGKAGNKAKAQLRLGLDCLAELGKNIAKGSLPNMKCHKLWKKSKKGGRVSAKIKIVYISNED